jgi:hypothetical protein
MKKLNIQITKAQIESFAVTLGENKPEVEITIGLYTETGKKITTYSISTDTWRDDAKFNLPASIVYPIMEIMKELEVIATRHCREGQATLGGGDET